MTAFHVATPRLQFRRDVCQALYSPRGKKGRYYNLVRTFETWWGRASRRARRRQMNRFRGRVV